MKILLLSADPARVDELRASLADTEGRHALSGAPLVMLADPAALRQEAPDLLLVDAREPEPALWPQLEKLAQALPQLVTAVVSENQSPEFLRLAMRAGVREVLPPGSGEVARLVGRVEQHLLRGAVHDKGRVLAFLPTKGSSGATFLATSLAYALSQHQGKSVLLIDLNLQVGDAAFFVSDKAPEFTLADVCRQIHRLDPSFLAGSATQVHPNFSVLASPGDPEQALEVKAEHVVRILKAAILHYDFVLLDVDRALDAVSIAALDHADLIFPVLQQSLPFLRDAARLQKIFASLGYGQERIRPVLNRFSKSEQVGVEDIEKSLGLKVWRTVPNSYHAVVASINQGVPLAALETAHHPVVAAVNGMADDLAGTAQSHESWLRRLLHH
ncbi:MAG: response regulator receiver protein [Moraxellaceae bacterium]|nr:response regulator receiver protein [Moraxellaceae bacterium]